MPNEPEPAGKVLLITDGEQVGAGYAGSRARAQGRSPAGPDGTKEARR